jgi:hypothetical protein
MTEYNRSEYPRLDLVFAAEGGYPFLLDATFWNEQGKVSKKLVNEPPSGKYLRALCICIILAKYRGDRGNPKEPIVMHERSDENSWLNSIGGSFGRDAQSNFFFEYFSKLHFILVKRGARHNTKKGKDKSGSFPSAAYDAQKLPLRNVNLFKLDSGKGDSDPAPLQRDELQGMAKTLENYAKELTERWKPLVPTLIRRFDSEVVKSKRAENSAQTEHEPLQPVLLKPSYQNLFDEVCKEAKGRVWDGDWFILCGTPIAFLEWKKIWIDSVKQQGSTVKFVCYSPDAPKSCPSVTALWRMNTKHLGVADGVKFLQERLNNLNYELATWSRDARADTVPFEKKRGHFEFYESFITQPYIAILFVPRNVAPVKKRSKRAQKGTWCVVGLYPLYPENPEERCGFYLNQPSPMLDIYYNSVLNFFELGLKDRYIKPMKFLARKGKKADG